MTKARTTLDEFAKLQARITFTKSCLDRGSASGVERDRLLVELKGLEDDREELTRMMGLMGEEVSAKSLTRKAREIVALVKAKEAPKPSLNESAENSDDGETFEQFVENFSQRNTTDRRQIITRLHADFVYFCETCLIITYRPGLNPDYPHGGFGPMVLSEGQRRVMRVLIKKLLEDEEPLRAIILKTRQLGNTTLLLAFACWLMCKFAHYHGMLIIDKNVHAKTKRNMMVGWFDYIAEKYGDAFPGSAIKRGGRGEKHLELNNGSMFFFESAESPNPGTSEMLHLLIESEKPKWPKGRAELVRTSVVPGIPRAKHTAHLDESTAQGHGPFKRRWDRVASLRAEDADLIPIFLPWMVSTEYRETPPPTCYNSLGEFIYLNDNEELYDYDEETDKMLTEKEYSKKYKLCPEQTFFRRKKITVDFDGVRAAFDQEYPTTPGHAFRLYQFGFFSPRLLRLWRDTADQCVWRGYINDAGGYSDVSRPCSYTDLTPNLVQDRRGSLFIRKFPVKGKEYFIGADVAEGKTIIDDNGQDDPDYNVFSIRDQYGKVVAYYVSRDKPEHIWYDLALVAIYYNMAWVNGERNNHGYTLLSFFWLTGYPNNVIYPGKTPAKERAWTYTSPKTRPLMLGNLRAALKADSGRFFPLHVEGGSVAQYTNFILNAKSGKPEAADGFHDDIVLADALSEQGRRWRFGDAVASEVYKKPEPKDETINVDTTWADQVIEKQGGFSLRDTDIVGMPMFNETGVW